MNFLNSSDQICFFPKLASSKHTAMLGSRVGWGSGRVGTFDQDVQNQENQNALEHW